MSVLSKAKFWTGLWAGRFFIWYFGLTGQRKDDRPGYLARRIDPTFMKDVAKAKEIIATVSAEKAATLNESMIQNIAKGRLNKFLKESCLLNQEYIWDKNFTVASYLKSVDKELTVTDFKRFTLRAE